MLIRLAALVLAGTAQVGPGQFICGTPDLSEAEAERTERTLSALPLVAADAARKIRVPVVFHQPDFEDNYSPDSYFRRTVKRLNRSFKRYGVTFSLAGMERYPYQDFSWDCNRRSVEAAFKQANAVDPARTLNIYLCDLFDADRLGWSYLPSVYPEDHYLHGVIIDRDYFTWPFDENDPYKHKWIEHEIGHYLGLYHTFEGGCSGHGDYVRDTPAQLQHHECGRIDTCPTKKGLDQVKNWMGYSWCSSILTRGQTGRMKKQVRAFKPTLWAASKP